MKVGIIGSGGREHAICEILKKSTKIDKIYCFPGNAGTVSIAENVNINLDNFEDLKNFILKNKIDLVFIGPEKPLVDGIVDYLEKFRIKVFGPNKIASQLEGSKIFTKQLCQKFKIPTAKFGVFENKEESIDFLDDLGDLGDLGNLGGGIDGGFQDLGDGLGQGIQRNPDPLPRSFPPVPTQEELETQRAVQLLQESTRRNDLLQKTTSESIPGVDSYTPDNVFFTSNRPFNHWYSGFRSTWVIDSEQIEGYHGDEGFGEPGAEGFANPKFPYKGIQYSPLFIQKSTDPQAPAINPSAKTAETIRQLRRLISVSINEIPSISNKSSGLMV